MSCAQEMSASKFEQVCGRGDAKKWKTSLWVVDKRGQTTCTMQVSAAAPDAILQGPLASLQWLPQSLCHQALRASNFSLFYSFFPLPKFCYHAADHNATMLHASSGYYCTYVAFYRRLSTFKIS